MLGLPSNSRKSHDRVHMSSLSSPTALNSGTRCKLEDAASSKTARKQESPQCHREPRAATHRATPPRDCCATHDTTRVRLLVARLVAGISSVASAVPTHTTYNIYREQKQQVIHTHTSG